MNESEGTRHRAALDPGPPPEASTGQFGVVEEFSREGVGLEIERGTSREENDGPE